MKCEISGDERHCSNHIKKIKMIVDKLPGEEELQNSSERFKAISDPTRLKIIYLLQDGELCVCEIIDALEKPQSTISHHLNVLKNAEIIKGRKEGIWVHYKLSNPKFVSIIDYFIK